MDVILIDLNMTTTIIDSSDTCHFVDTAAGRRAHLKFVCNLHLKPHSLLLDTSTPCIYANYISLNEAGWSTFLRETVIVHRKSCWFDS